MKNDEADVLELIMDRYKKTLSTLLQPRSNPNLSAIESRLYSTTFSKICQTIKEFIQNAENTGAICRIFAEINGYNNLLDGFDGKLKSSKCAKIAKCSPNTALRDIRDLIEKGILQQEQAEDRSTNYVLLQS
jgi:Fic family protein